MQMILRTLIARTSAPYLWLQHGAGVALRVAIRHPDVVRKLVLASATYTLDGVHPGLMEGLADMKPEMMFGSPWHEEYIKIAPHLKILPRHLPKTQIDRQPRSTRREHTSN
jgi:pimeloyl-ACP methyl ester carboxylesterase